MRTFQSHWFGREITDGNYYWPGPAHIGLSDYACYVLGIAMHRLVRVSEIGAQCWAISSLGRLSDHMIHVTLAFGNRCAAAAAFAV